MWRPLIVTRGGVTFKEGGRTASPLEFHPHCGRDESSAAEALMSSCNYCGLPNE